MVLTWLLPLLSCISLGLSLDNGVARTPPMGWLTWERFRCNTDCDNDPDNCLSEKLIKTMADHMASGGYVAAGYKYITVDDCWPSKNRTKDGKLQPDPKRFPSGMKALADYVHGKGMKFGIYGDFGHLTCGGYPGSEFYMQSDAETFAEWGVDLLKLDGCYSSVKDYPFGYPAMGFWLNQTGRPILYSCSWPAYLRGQPINYKEIAKVCNMWRNYGDIEDSWDSVKSIVNFYGDDKYNFSAVAGPGNWNDPDMLIIGDFALSHEQEKTQMAMWAMMASPLIMSVDLRNIDPEAAKILLNKHVIAINQDPLGKQGTLLLKVSNVQIWKRALFPVGKFAIAAINFGVAGTPSKVKLTCEELGLTNAGGYNITETFEDKFFGHFALKDTFTVDIDPSGVFLATFVPTPKSHDLKFVKYYNNENRINPKHRIFN